MRVFRTLGVSAGVAIGVAALAVVAVLGLTRSTRGHETATAATSTVDGVISSTAASAWPERELRGTAELTGQVPLTVSSGRAKLLGRHPSGAELKLRFALPIRDRAKLDALIAVQARTHTHLSHQQVYDAFSPPREQLAALRVWLEREGFTITHVGADRLALTAVAPTATVQEALDVKINDYIRPATSFRGLKVDPYRFYANTKAPTVPAFLGLQSISGLSDVDRFYTQAQLDSGNLDGTLSGGDCSEDEDNATVNPLCIDVRGGGYFPSDLKGLYDVAGHGFDGSGQTIGFTLWTAAERQQAMTRYATETGDTPITVDANCVASGNSPTTPSSCTTRTVQPDHLLFILENGNADNNFGSNIETALDIEGAHAVADHVAMKYYAADCASTTPPGSGLTNAGCNGSDVGLEETLEDAANDPTLHSVSNSWGFGGEAEWGAADPFLLAAENSMAIGAAAGTTFYFSTGDSGTYFSGYPADSPNVVATGGTSTYSTSNSAQWSTSTTWSGGGSWCSSIFPRPAWQTGAGVAANAPCPGRVVPDISGIADPGTGIRTVWTTSTAGGTSAGQVGGTSLTAPVMNGLQAVTQNFVAAQSYPGPKPKVGFMGPLLYQLGNSPDAGSFYRDIECGNTANPTGGPDGDSATKGWDAATGWGEPDWFNFATGIAMQLGATNLSVPASLNRHFQWTCAKTPSNSSERAFSCPSASTCYAVGAASGNTPWYGKFLPGGAWGAVNTFFKSTDGGATWFPSNSDMFSIECTSSATCLTVGAGGLERRTSDGGDTWTDVATAPGNNKPLTQVTCPSSSTCYAVGDRGNAMKSTDGGLTWSWLNTTDGNPLYGLSCPTTEVCYATDIYAHVVKTTNGGATWTWQQTPITTPGVQVPGSGGPNPFAGSLAISCPTTQTCVASGFYVVPGGQTIPSTDPPLITTANGGTTWTLQTSGAGAGNYLHSISCLANTTTCWAVGRGGRIVTTTDLTTWTAQPSNTTSLLNSVLCLSTTFCVAVGQNGTVDLYNGTAWTATTGNGGTGTLADVDCDGNLVCYATGKQGVTLLSTTGGTSWTVKAGGGTTQQMNGISCPSDGTCYAAGNGGTILRTTNGGQTWSPATSGTTSNLNGIACTSATACVTVGAVAAGAATVRTTTDGTTWNGGSGTGANALNGVACTSATACVAVGAAGGIVGSSDGGATWSPRTSGVAAALNAVSCPAGACYAVGAAAAGAGTLLKSTDNGATWSPQASNTTQSLSGVACVSAAFCIADGATGTTVVTSDGSTWAQQGNPVSGPTTALNASNIALNGAGCNAGRCFVGLGAQGDVLTTPLVTVTIHATGVYGSAPGLTLPASSPRLSFSPAGEAGNVTGTVTCTSTVVQSSPAGSYPLTSCTGLADDGFNVVYDYAGSSYTVTKAPLTVTADAKSRLFGEPTPPLTATLSGFVLGQGLATSGVTGQAACTTTAQQFSPAGAYPVTCAQGTLDAQNYSFGPFVPGTLTVTYSAPCITSVRAGPLTVGAGQAVCVAAGAVVSGPITVAAGGALDIEGGLVTGSIRSTGATAFRMCGAQVSGPVTVTGTTGLVLVGGDAATGPCAPSTITGPVTITGSSGGVEFNGNTVTGSLVITGNTGSVPPPDIGPVHAVGNTVVGPKTIQ
jgi:photosystem II stability/assembly factor-like uncharacterized protein